MAARPPGSHARVWGANLERTAAISAGDRSTVYLVRITYALTGRNSTTSLLGQYGEKPVAAAFGGIAMTFHQKGYDVVFATGESRSRRRHTRLAADSYDAKFDRAEVVLHILAEDQATVRAAAEPEPSRPG
jgi:hypothetical protein